MIIITVASYNGTPTPQRLAAQFDELGGNIGRAENNQLVLPDPERTISRVHAQVVFRAGDVLSVAAGAHQSREWCKGKGALLVSGVGHAASFQSTAEDLGVKILGEVAYPDHYAYSREDIEQLGKQAIGLKADIVLTTEKDAGKLRPYLRPDDASWWAVRLHVEWRAGCRDRRA